MSKITLQCVKEGRTKLRVRFHSFTDEEGRVFTNVYDNSFNCQFPRSIREEGRFYEIGPDDLSLVNGGSRQPFYKVRAAGIRIVGDGESVVVKPPHHRATETSASSSRSTAVGAGAPIDLSEIKIFEVTDCVVCLSTAPNEVFLPCAHKCVCAACSKEIKRHSGNCPLCRRRITSTIAA